VFLGSNVRAVGIVGAAGVVQSIVGGSRWSRARPIGGMGEVEQWEAARWNMNAEEACKEDESANDATCYGCSVGLGFCSCGCDEGRETGSQVIVTLTHTIWTN